MPCGTFHYKNATVSNYTLFILGFCQSLMIPINTRAWSGVANHGCVLIRDMIEVDFFFQDSYIYVEVQVINFIELS